VRTRAEMGRKLRIVNIQGIMLPWEAIESAIISDGIVKEMEGLAETVLDNGYPMS
jgi:hypothetical protein